MSTAHDQIHVFAQDNRPVAPEIEAKEDVIAIENVVDEKHTFTRQDEVGAALVDQQHAIPTTGARQLTSKWEYAFYLIFNFSNNGARQSPLNVVEHDSQLAIGGNGGALRQALLSLQFPSGMVPWAGGLIPSEYAVS